jgi:hypothetical protein
MKLVRRQSRFDYLKDKRKAIAVVLVGASAFFGILILIEVAGYFVASANVKRLISDAVARGKLDVNEMEEYSAKSKAIADELKKNNLFAPPPPKQPLKQISGIMGDEVVINHKWYKVGDMVGDTKIIAIEPTQIRAEWEGKELVLKPIQAASASGPEERPPKPVVRKPEHIEVAPLVEKPVEEKVSDTSGEEDPLAWMGVELSASAKAKFLEHWDKMSDEEKERVKEQWNKMSDDEKQKAVDVMEQNM